ncbi:HD-GYP domain-containing protein [Pleomorphomonas koreensis]|uniref:HD-GYP domain-containing protein n=1 Tax=Pleomorphomonas koreensis TaxID=257440 RepID=UPI00146DEEF3|nr:HD domain-containing phosphohydrolase [Pleomorphomonas koreensis]
MHTRQTTIHIAAEDAGEAAGLCRELMVRGFHGATRSLTGEGLGQIGADDILVIAGDFERMNGGERRLPALSHAVRGRTIVFVTRLRPADIAGLGRAGFRYINTATTPTVDNLVFLITQIDPNTVYRASKQQALRVEKAAAIETGVLSFFRMLRDGGPMAPAEEVERQRREMDDIIGMSPMSVWLDLFQNYHDGTAQHCSLVSGFTLAFARKLGFNDRDTSRLYDAAFFHDIGKAVIPLEILDKPGRLIASEWEIMKSHASRGYEILTRDDRTAGEIARIARDHHEYLDGSGYPNGLTAAKIGDPTRILTICDIFAALVEKRAYKSPKSPEEAYAILASMAGSKLDPDLVRLFEAVVADYDTGQAGRLFEGTGIV